MDNRWRVTPQEAAWFWTDPNLSLDDDQAVALNRCNNEVVIYVNSGTGGLIHDVSLRDCIYRLNARTGSFVPGVIALDHGAAVSIVEPISTVEEQLTEVRSILNLSVVDLAKVMLVERQTVYEWLEGREPRAHHRQRLNDLHSIALSWGRHRDPLPRKYLHAPVQEGQTLFQVLSEDRLDRQLVELCLATLQDKMAGEKTKRIKPFRQSSREERLNRLRRTSSIATRESDD